MQIKNDAYKIQLLSYQQSPTVESIMWYNPLGFSSEEALCVANQYRVLRYNQMDQDVSPALEVSLLKQFTENRLLMIHFLRRLTLPVFPREIPLQRSLENQIMHLQLNTEILESMNLWQQYLEANFESLRNLIKSLLSASWDGFSAQINLLSQILVLKDIANSTPTYVQKQDPIALCKVYYKPTSKRKINKKIRAELSDEQQQCFINKGFNGYSNFKDLYSALTQQFNLQVQKEFEENNGWICHLRWNKVLISKRGSDKKTAFLDAALNFVKLVAPVIFERVIVDCKTDYLSILSSQGSIRSSEMKKIQKFQLEDDFVKNAPFDHLKTEDYIKQLGNLEISKIKKAQNNIIEHLVRISNKKINRSIDSVDSTFVLNLYYSQDCEQIHIHRVFSTSLRFCHAKLIAQQFVIEHLVRLWGSLLRKSDFFIIMLINDLNNLMSHEDQKLKFIGDQGSDVDVKMHSMRDIIASLRKQLISEHLHVEKKESVQVRVLQPEEPIKVIWDLIGMAFIFLQMISIPLILVFSLDLDPAFNTFSQIMDFYFIMDIVISFQTGYYNNGHFITSRKHIALNYLRFWFWIDLVSSFPYDEVILWGTSGDGPNLSVIKFVRFIKFVKIIRLVRALKLKKIINQLEDYLSLDTKITSVLGFLKISVMIMCISHWLACCWSLIDILENSGNTWYRVYSSDPNWQIEYISGLYFSVTTMITVGYGDIVPITYEEKLFSVVVMIVSTNFYGYIMSSIVAIFQSEDEGTTMVMEKNDVILKYIKQKSISINLQQRVKNYLQWLSNQEQIARNYECIIIQSLSINLKREILIQVQAKFVIHISFISHNFDRGLIDKVAFNLVETMLGPEEYVFKDTDSIDDNTCLYYITNGQVEIQAVYKIKKLKKRKADNQSYFGEISFIANRKRCASVKTLTFVNLLYISRISFVSLLSQADLEKWFEIKFQIENEDNLCSLHINCYICRLPGHVAKYCPTVHYVVSSDKVLQLVEQQQFEITSKHKLKKQCTLKLLTQNKFAIQKIQDEMPNIMYSVQKQQERNQLKDSFINDKVQQYTCFTPKNNLQSIVSFQNDAADFYIKQIKSEKASKLVAEKFSKLKSKLNFKSKYGFLNLVKQAKQAADDSKSQVNSSSEELSNPLSNQTSRSPSPYTVAKRSIDQNMGQMSAMRSKYSIEKQSSHEEQKRLTSLPRRSQHRGATSHNAIQIQLEKLQINHKVIEVPGILEESPKQISYYSKEVK